MSDYLPQEVVNDILVRLPVKSLLRFRCVCKEWLALISSPNFISQHLSHTKSSPTAHTLVRHYSQPDGVHTYSVYNNHTFTGEITTFTPPVKFKEGWDIVGYYNGVLCLCDSFYCEGTFILWNPSIRRATRRVTIASPGYHTVASGFGFDSVSNDYKIIRVSYFRQTGYEFPPKVEVFSLSVGEWRLIESNVTSVICRILSWQAVKDNVLHWTGYKKEPVRSRIVSFDLNTEIFGEMSLPKPLECKPPVFTSIVMLGTLISVLCYDWYSIDKSCAIWAMKEYGNADSWVYQYNIDMKGAMLIGVLRNNAILVAPRNGGLLSYNYEKRTRMVTGICGTKLVTFAGTYVESLVLVDKGREIPKGDSESDNEHENRLVKKIKVSCSSLSSTLPST